MFFISSPQRSCRKGSYADKHGLRRDTPEGHRRQHQFVLQQRHLHPHKIRKGPVVVREPAGTVHGAVGAPRFWEILLR